ncbi:MAG TPA: hypothetical protein VED59_03890 [Acidimicrobiales bacterium]|nr:hypothetical protein [Acidimicrobiales bacterium]
MSLLRRGASTPLAPDTPATNGATPNPPTERQQRAVERATRVQTARQARKATSIMVPPEPRYAVYVVVVMVAVALVSLFSKDVEQVTSRVQGTSCTLVSKGHWTCAVPHAQVVGSVVSILVLIAAGAATILWKRRLVTAMALMLCAILATQLPLPLSMQDLRLVIYGVPFAYAIWVVFRQSKSQKAFTAKTGPGGSNVRAGTSKQGPPSRNASGRPGAGRAQPPQASPRRKGDGKQAVSATGRALPQDSRRYTRPRSKPRAGQRKR